MSVQDFIKKSILQSDNYATTCLVDWSLYL